ncbi:myoneurin isoform X4 [Anabrus simplex]|uniref:myoneurin isoform X4 n=1 Tax=Anabrus simplex TaxID=316456 RepID=UPI0035A32880
MKKKASLGRITRSAKSSRKLRANESVRAREIRLGYNREAIASRRQRESSEEREIRLSKNRERLYVRRRNETQREKRLFVDKIRHALRRLFEIHVERQRRLHSLRMYKSIQRRNDTSSNRGSTLGASVHSRIWGRAVNKERVGNPLFETSGEPEAVIVKTEPFTEENASDEQNPATVDALELRIKEEPEDNTVQPESVTVRNMETVVVKEEITFEEPDVHFEESSTEYDFLSSDVRNGDRPWTGGAECPVCGKWFKSDLVVNTHLKNHVDTRRYKCKLCSNKYRHLRNLKLHLESHADKKPIACETCHKLFRSKLALNKHRLAQECVEVASRAVMTNPHMHRERL